MSKIKGTKAERELLKMLWHNGWATIRSAGSGSMKFPSPDLLAGKGERKLAIECKATADTSKYFEKEDIFELKEFGRMFGAEPWVALRFDREAWLFINPMDLDETEKSFSITKEKARMKGLSVEEVIR
ncbi:Holliday junction resolvase [Candidatus Woesearchaeota archaeon]|nr:Holliday junction resolvase [Candidatus Woesearchaeota archaeon]